MKQFFLVLCLTFFGAINCFADLQENKMTENKHPTFLVKTTAGDIKIELDATKAPKTVANFIEYVKSKHYDGTIFHRVIDNFMIQGGGFTADMKQKPTKAPIAIESDNGLKNKTGTLAMARTADPDSATAQFFINVKDNDFLDFRGKNTRDYGYTVFGKVTEGMDVVNKIKTVKTTSKSMSQDVPVETIEIISITPLAS